MAPAGLQSDSHLHPLQASYSSLEHCYCHRNHSSKKFSERRQTLPDIETSVHRNHPPSREAHLAGTCRRISDLCSEKHEHRWNSTALQDKYCQRRADHTPFHKGLRHLHRYGRCRHNQCRLDFPDYLCKVAYKHLGYTSHQHRMNRHRYLLV